MRVRAKFKCIENKESSDDPEQYNISFEPVISGSDENKNFFKWTPSGKIELSVVSEKTASNFILFEEYYVDFTKATEVYYD